MWVGMLSLWKLRVGAEAYYLGQVARGLDDYYTGAGEVPGRWLGNASGGVGLAGAVTGEDLRAVLAGLNPGTGQTPNRDRLRTWKGRVPGFDLTFSAAKSVSVLYTLADPFGARPDRRGSRRGGWRCGRLVGARACFVPARLKPPGHERRGRSAAFGTRRLPGGGFVAAGSRHRTSRAGDPQLHTHVLVANVARTRHTPGRPPNHHRVRSAPQAPRARRDHLRASPVTSNSHLAGSQRATKLSRRAFVSVTPACYRERSRSPRQLRHRMSAPNHGLAARNTTPNGIPLWPNGPQRRHWLRMTCRPNDRVAVRTTAPWRHSRVGRQAPLGTSTPNACPSFGVGDGRRGSGRRTVRGWAEAVGRSVEWYPESPGTPVWMCPTGRLR